MGFSKKSLVNIFSVFCLVSCSAWAEVGNFQIKFLGGTFFGPGRMPDVPMAKGIMHVVELDKNLKGITPYFNNGAEKPNIRSRVPFHPELEGVLSSNIAFNENMDGGVVDVGNGALKLLNVVIKDGPNNGTQSYELTRQCDWKITTDLALDPGFKPGILVTPNLVITSGVVSIPISLQTKHGIPGSADFAGSVPSRAKLVGRVGDYDEDGFLDGYLTGTAVIPLDHIFYPGAPVAQARIFISNIPISHLNAAGLSLYSIQNYKQIFKDIFSDKKSKDVVVYYNAQFRDYLNDIESRLASAIAHLDKIEIPDSALFKETKQGISELLSELSLVVLEVENSDKEKLKLILKKSQKLAKQLEKVMTIRCG